MGIQGAQPQPQNGPETAKGAPYFKATNGLSVQCNFNEFSGIPRPVDRPILSATKM